MLTPAPRGSLRGWELRMFYAISAYNTQTRYVWAASAADVGRYVDHLNADREINLYAAKPIPESEWASYEGRSDVLSMDEPGWDDFMEA